MKKNDKKKGQLLARLKHLEHQTTELNQEHTKVATATKKYYDKAGNLFEEHTTRLDVELVRVFKLERMEAYRSRYVLIRDTKQRTILDHLRKAKVWK